MSRTGHPSHEEYRDATALVLEETEGHDLIDAMLAIRPQAEQELALQQLGAINSVVSYGQVDDRIEYTPRPALELGAIAGFLVVRSVYGTSLPASQIFATMAPHAAPPSNGLFGENPKPISKQEYADLAARPGVTRDVIAETNRSIRMAGKLGLAMIGEEARSIVELRSIAEHDPVDFQHGFGFSIMGAKRAHEYIQRSVEAMIASDEFNRL